MFFFHIDIFDSFLDMEYMWIEVLDIVVKIVAMLKAVISLLKAIWVFYLGGSSGM